MLLVATSATPLAPVETGFSSRWRDRDDAQAGRRSTALRPTVEDVYIRSIRRENRLDRMIEGRRGSGAYGENAILGQILGLAVLRSQIVWIVDRGRLLIGIQMHNAVHGELSAGSDARSRRNAARVLVGVVARVRNHAGRRTRCLSRVLHKSQMRWCRLDLPRRERHWADSAHSSRSR